MKKSAYSKNSLHTLKIIQPLKATHEVAFSVFNIVLFHVKIIKEVIDMENNKKEKAIASAIASLRIDKIYLKDEFINEYRKKNNLHVEQAPKLTLRKVANKWH